MTMAGRIKDLRKKNGWTQEELGMKLGLQKSAIAKYENGRVEHLKASTILKMSDIFGVKPSYLMGWSDDPYDKSAALSLSATEKSLILAYRKSSEEVQSMIRKMLDVMERGNEEQAEDTLSELSMEEQKEKLKNMVIRKKAEAAAENKKLIG